MSGARWRTVGLGLCCFVTVWVLSGATDTDCAHENAAVTGCLAPVIQFSGKVSISPYSQSELENHCRNVVAAESCLESHHCEEDTSKILKTTWAGVKASFHYLCNEGKAEYLNETDCWNSHELQHDMAGCARRNAAKTEKLKKTGKATPEAECELDNDWVDCINDAAEDDPHCDEAASEVAKMFAIRSLEPVSENANCHLGEVDDEDTDEHEDDGASCAQISAALLAAALLLNLAF